MHLEIFIHYDGQLRTSHLILDGIPSYTSYHDLEQALTISSPLLFYIDVRLRGFLPRGLTLFDARRLSPWQVRKGSLLPAMDGSADRVFHNQAENIPVKEPIAAEPIPVEEIESKELAIEMVVWRKMIPDRFLLGGWSAPQQQPPFPLAPHGHFWPHKAPHWCNLKPFPDLDCCAIGHSGTTLQPEAHRADRLQYCPLLCAPLPRLLVFSCWGTALFPRIPSFETKPVDMVVRLWITSGRHFCCLMICNTSTMAAMRPSLLGSNDTLSW